MIVTNGQNAFDFAINRLARIVPLYWLCTSMGDASYATYLSHDYIVELVRKFGFHKYNLINPYTRLGAAVIVMTSLLLGQLLYKWIDKPLTRYTKDRSSLMRSAPPGVPLL